MTDDSFLDAQAAKEAPPPKAKQLSVRLKPEIHERLRKASETTGTSINEMLGRLVEAAGDLPKYAADAAHAFDAVLQSPQSLIQLTNLLNDEIQNSLRDGDRHDFEYVTLVRGDVRLIGVAYWQDIDALKLKLSWELVTKSWPFTGFHHATYRADVSGGGDLHMSPESKLRATKTTLRVLVASTKGQKTQSEEQAREPEGIIDDDLPF